MKVIRIISVIGVLAGLFCFLSAAHVSEGSEELWAENTSSNGEAILPRSVLPKLIAAYHGYGSEEVKPGSRSVGNPVSDQGGIREDIPAKYQPRYQRWKKEFLATEMGRTEWSSYAQNPDFMLTIAISSDNDRGASTGEYRWNRDGKLVAARISLGSNIDEGVPNPIYYPVMNSLNQAVSSREINDNILAATKIAHEFGHVRRMGVSMDSSLYHRQVQLISFYNKIFLSNGRDTSDPRLLELKSQIGGTPVEIWEDREYWGESNAMLYIRDRFDPGFRCSLFNKIKRSVDLYAKGYEARFVEIARSVPSSQRCAWE